MELKNNYFLLRHGETVYQTKKRGMIYPWPEKKPVLLTERGRRQIRTAASKLKNKKIDLIYSSDFNRARQTAQIVAKALGLKIVFDKRLRDDKMGIFSGLPKKEFYAVFTSLRERFFKKPQNGESWNDTKKRMVAFLKEIDRKYENKNILIISHGDPLWLLEGVVKRMNGQELLEKKFSKKTIKVGEIRKLFMVNHIEP